MHLLDLWYEGASRARSGHLAFVLPEGGKRQWTFLPDDEAGEEILRLIALLCGGLPFLARLGFRLGRLVRKRYGWLRVEARLELHAPRDQQVGTLIGLGLEVAGDGSDHHLCAAERRLAPPGAQWRRRLPLDGTGIRPCLHLAYGSAFSLRRSAMGRDFEDPWFRTAPGRLDLARQGHAHRPGGVCGQARLPLPGNSSRRCSAAGSW